MDDKSKLRVPYAMSVHGEDEINACVEVLRTSTQMGPCVGKFEKNIASSFDKSHGIFVNSGSSALLLSLEAFKFPQGGEVITPALTFGTTVSSIVKAGLKPAFVDVGLTTLNIDSSKVNEMITENTVAMCVPNLMGNLNRPGFTKDSIT